MAPIFTQYIAPLDRLMTDASLWIESMSMMWILLALVVGIAITVAVLARRRQRAQARLPHYRRMSARYSRLDTER
ncbi:MAG: hypothetical protein LH471_01740 [Salinibacterium sp.]|nr:hypothetical protein [Salinibacterium sp.]